MKHPILIALMITYVAIVGLPIVVSDIRAAWDCRHDGIVVANAFGAECVKGGK